MFIFLVRHAQPFWREEAKDPNNPELTELGIEQGKITGNYINLLKSMDITFDTIWHSELTRSRQTAELISKELVSNMSKFKSILELANRCPLLPPSFSIKLKSNILYEFFVADLYST